MTSCAWRFVPTKSRVLAVGGEVGDELFGLAELLDGLVQIDDVDAVPLAEDEFLHLRIPPLRLVAEVNAGLQQILHRNPGQRFLLFVASVNVC